MKRSTLKIAVVAVLAVGAIVAVAGTVDDVQTEGASGPDANANEATERPTTTQVPDETDDRTTTQVPAGGDQDCVALASNPFVVVGLLAAWAAIVYWIYQRNGPVEAGAAFMLILIFVFLVYPPLAICGTESDYTQRNQSGGVPEIPNQSDGGGGVSGEGSGEAAPSTPTLPLAVIAIVAIVAAAAVGGVLVTQDDDGDDDLFGETDAETEPEVADADVDEFAAAAGRAADRIERTDDLDNEIYRAWVEMTEPIDVDHPNSSTPREFETAAVAAGIDRDDAREVTDLFERVRYGTDEPTPEREDRALDALRRIDAQYGGDDE